MEKDRRVCKRLERVEVTNVIVTKLLRGEGNEKDPVRYVYQYWDMNGKFLFELDDIDDHTNEVNELFKSDPA